MNSGEKLQIFDALLNLGYIELKLISDGRISVTLNGIMSGIWDTQRNTFVD